jgi:hypothetical protein
VLLDAAAVPVADPKPLPGERAALEAFRERHIVRRTARSVRIRRSAGAVAAGVGLVLTSGTAAAATGVLPDRAQHLAHAWFDKIGISLPDAGATVERRTTRDRRGVELPDQPRRSVSAPLAEGLGSLRSTDAQAAIAGPPRDARDSDKVQHGHESPTATYSQPSPEPAGNGSTPQSDTHGAPTLPGPAPATPPADPHTTPSVDPNTGPPADPGDQSPGNPQDKRRDPSNRAVPSPAGAASPESPPANQFDRQTPHQETSQRRPR